MLEFIKKINSIIAFSKNFSEIGDAIAEIISERVSVDWMSLCIPRGDNLIVKAVSSKVPTYFKEDEEVPLKGTATEYVVKTKEILYEEDLLKESRFYTAKYHIETGIRSMLRIPLISEGEVFAVWVLASRKPYAFSKDDIELLKSIAEQISAPLKVHILYDELRKQNELIESVYNLSQIVFSEIDINRVFHRFSKELKKFIPFERLNIAIIEGEYLRYMAVAEEIDAERKEGFLIPLKDTASYWVIKNRKTLIRNDLTKEAKFPLDEKKIKEGIRSSMHVPLFYKGKIFGTLNFSSAYPNVYKEREKKIAEILSSQISHIIAISYLYSPFYNHLTEVYNRRYFDEKIEEEIKNKERYGGVFSLCLCDLDNFKSYNDRYGHLEGDNCLKEIAQIIKNNVRKTDFVFRYGGDEFAILMPNTTLDSAVKIIERVKNKIKEKFKEITISAGIVSYPKDGKTRTELIDKADILLLQAKKKKDIILTTLDTNYNF
jgi:diguanylate cyclase (GGDEF)-like protein